MSTMRCKVFSLLLLLILPAFAYAHFGLVLPSDDILTQEDTPTLGLDVRFLHPFEGDQMEMAAPVRFGLFHNGKTIDLLSTLQAAGGKDGIPSFWHSEYTVKKPGDYVFFVEPQPYWEPAEDSFIIHYTKVCVHALGLEIGWDEPLGLETEIIPLTRPYALWTGNLFTGRVLLDGKPVAGAEIEVEYLNASAENPAPVKAPADAYITQVVKADDNGVFSYAMPRAGWWGFAALNEAKRTIDHDGVAKPVELGAVYWVHIRDM
ncbi:MAG: hypothetical protein CSA21_03990 [Deltaproteobacteria bacterium]|nr:MAG: hypothetical protein CSA21_03990 [Deltaproteobacteria bacterium]